MHNTPLRSIVSRILGFGAAALLGAAASASAAQDVWVSSSSTIFNEPIWVPPGLFVPFNNWSTGAPPTPAEDAIFPGTIPTFPFFAAAPPPLDQFASGKIILLLSIPQGFAPPGFPATQLTANSLTFQNNYRLVDLNTLSPVSPFGFPSAPLLLSSGNITVVKGATAEIDFGLQSTNNTITKLGRGTLLLNGEVFGNLDVRQGTLGVGSTFSIDPSTFAVSNTPGTIRVDGKFTLKKNTTFAVQLASPNSYGQVHVNGSANLAGTLSVSYVNGFEVQRGQSFDIIHADNGVNGRFSTLTDSHATGTLLTLGINYRPHDVYLEILQGSFAGLPGLTPNQLSVGRELDNVVNDHRASTLIDHLDRLPLNDVPGALDRIAPEELTSIFTMGVAVDKVQVDNIQRRNEEIRAGSSGFSAAGLAMQGTGPGYSGTFGINTGVAGPNGNDGKESKEMKTVAPEEKRWGIFLSGTGEWLSVSDDRNARGYDLSSGGFTVGVDYKVCPNFAVGLSAGYVGISSDLNDGGRVSVNGGKLGLYATTFAGGWYADVAVDGGYSSYDMHRAGFEGTARGSTDGGDLNVLFGTGYDFKKGAFTFGPTATFNYTYVGVGGFDERGSLAPLRFGSQGQDSLRSAFGFKASYDCKVGGLVIRPEIRAAWQHEYGDSAYQIDSSFANGAGGVFSVNGPKLGRDSALLGAGFAIQCSERCTTYFYYDGELGRTNYHSAAVTGGVRFAF